MPITDLLERNSKLYGDEIALVEINPEVQEEQRVTWKEYALIQPTSTAPYRREITWSVFDEKANRVANMLLSRGIRKGQKVAVLLMNCLEWLPIYFGILKAGAVAVPLNFRYTSDEIVRCAEAGRVARESHGREAGPAAVATTLRPRDAAVSQVTAGCRGGHDLTRTSRRGGVRRHRPGKRRSVEDVKTAADPRAGH